jgi:hypothetical protein
LIIDSMVFSTASVSGTFSSSTTLRPGIFFSAAAPCGVRLVVAVVVARPDIDEADRGVGRAAERPPSAVPSVSAALPLQEMPS